MACGKTPDDFRCELTTQKNLILKYCQNWRAVSEKDVIIEDILGDINLAIGQGELLVQEKFSQFDSLINDCKSQSSEKEVRIDDLQGFWDIIMLQVDKVMAKFSELHKIKDNNWQRVEATSVERVKKPVLTKRGVRKPCGKSSIREHILAERKKKALLEANVKCGVLCQSNSQRTAPAKMPTVIISETKDENCPPVSSIKQFDAGFFTVESPVRAKVSSLKVKCDDVLIPTGAQKMSPKTKTRPVIHKDYSPCMRVTRSAKKRLMSSSVVTKLQL